MSQLTLLEKIKGHGKIQGGHLEVLYTILKCCEDFEFSLCQASRKFLSLRLVPMNGTKRNKERQGGTHLSAPNICFPPLQQLGPQVGESQPEGILREKRKRRAKGKIERVTHLGILKGLYCPPATGSFPATCWALWVSPTNPEGL